MSEINVVNKVESGVEGERGERKRGREGEADIVGEIGGRGSPLHKIYNLIM